MPTAMRSNSREALGQHAAEHELAEEQAEQRERLLHADAPVREHGDREHRLRGGEEQLLALERVERQAVQRDRRRSRTRSASDPTSSVHWLTFDDSSVPNPALVLSRHANIPATMSSGASDASGATHCTSRNVSIPACSPRCTSDSANGSAHAKITTAGEHEQRRRRRCVAVARRERADQLAPGRRGAVPPTATGAMRTTNTTKMPMRIDRVEERQRALQRQRERVERGDREERDLDRVRPLEVHVGVELAGVAARAGRCASSATRRAAPPSTSRCRSAAGCEPVMLARASGAYFSGFSPAFHANVKSTAYSGSTAMSASTVSARPCGDVELEHLGRPGEQERRAEDREPEDHGRHDVGESRRRGHGRRARERDERPRRRWPERSRARVWSVSAVRGGHPPHPTGDEGFRAAADG